MSLWDIKDLSQFLKVKRSTLYAWAAQGKIPCVKIHGLIRFKSEEIEAWLESFRKMEPVKPFVIPKKTKHKDLNALIARVKEEVYNTRIGRSDRDQARKEGNDGPV